MSEKENNNCRWRCCGFFTAANLDENKYDVIILEQNSDVLQK
jgi:hypothetical protein